MTDISGLEPSLVGVAGEYFVAAEMSLRGWLASVTLRNSRGIDIIASSGDASKSVSIQVKASKGGTPSWRLTKKSEGFFSVSHFYVFVILKSLDARPDFYIAPSKVVADYIYTEHRKWLRGSKSDGTPRKDSSIRKFEDTKGQYRERWDILGL